MCRTDLITNLTEYDDGSARQQFVDNERFSDENIAKKVSDLFFFRFILFNIEVRSIKGKKSESVGVIVSQIERIISHTLASVSLVISSVTSLRPRKMITNDYPVTHLP